MDPLAIIILLVLAGAVLLAGELVLPTHGVLGGIGLLALAGAIAECLLIDRTIGLIVLIATIVSGPFAFAGMMAIWRRSPIGRRIILQQIEPPPHGQSVAIGQVGITRTEMRPMGECEFGNIRLEAIAQLGMIEPGARVKVVAIENGRPTVRAIEA